MISVGTESIENGVDHTIVNPATSKLTPTGAETKLPSSSDDKMTLVNKCEKSVI